MPISSKSNSKGIWRPVMYPTELEVGGVVRVRPAAEIYPLLSHLNLFEYREFLTGTYKFMSFTSDMDEMCEGTYRIIDKRDDLVQLDTLRLNPSGEHYWFHFIFLELED